MDDMINAAAGVSSALGKDHVSLKVLKQAKQTEEQMVALVQQATDNLRGQNQPVSEGSRGTKVNVLA
ncbi:MAG: hypothetical protein HZC25_09680 [Rhodospirillales bacterium]|nr:hypothetical protein [Rhodospirillales bacterium]